MEKIQLYRGFGCIYAHKNENLQKTRVSATSCVFEYYISNIKNQKRKKLRENWKTLHNLVLLVGFLIFRVLVCQLVGQKNQKKVRVFSGCKIVTIKNSLRTTCLAHIPIHGKTKQIVGVHFCVRVGLPRYSWVLVCTVDLLLHHGWLYRGYTGQNKRLCNQLMSIRPCRPFTQVSTLAHMVNLSQENAISWTSSLL